MWQCQRACRFRLALSVIVCIIALFAQVLFAASEAIHMRLASRGLQTVPVLAVVLVFALGSNDAAPGAQAQGALVRLVVGPNTSARSDVLDLSPGAGVTAQLEPMVGPVDGVVRVAVYDANDVLAALDDPEQTSEAFRWAPAGVGRYRVVVTNTNSTGIVVNLRRPDTPITRSPPTNATFATVRVWFATNRAPLSGLTGQFGNDPSDDATVGYSDVSIPRDHRMGELEAPSIWRLEFSDDPARHVSLLRVEPRPMETFLEQVRDRVRQSPTRQALVFIHGFNETFADAVRRTAQIAYDLGFDGPAIAFSWPSQGRLDPLDYTKDQRNADVSAAALATFFERLRAGDGRVTLHVVAHSMGNRVLARALENMAVAAAGGARPLQEVAMMAPDIDAKLFRQAAGKIARTAQRVTLYVSSQDVALRAAQRIAGYPRAGEGGRNVVVVPGIDTIDASEVDTSLLGLGHSYYADNTTILSDLFAVIRGRRPEERFRLEKQTTADGLYWRFRPAIR